MVGLDGKEIKVGQEVAYHKRPDWGPHGWDFGKVASVDEESQQVSITTIVVGPEVVKQVRYTNPEPEQIDVCAGSGMGEVKVHGRYDLENGDTLFCFEFLEGGECPWMILYKAEEDKWLVKRYRGRGDTVEAKVITKRRS
jgi:hypothetical protein